MSCATQFVGGLERNEDGVMKTREVGNLFRQRRSSCRRYLQVVDCVTDALGGGGGWAGVVCGRVGVLSHAGSYSWVSPPRSKEAGLQSCHRWLSHAFTHNLCVPECVRVCHPMQRYSQNLREPWSRWQQGMLQGARVFVHEPMCVCVCGLFFLQVGLSFFRQCLLSWNNARQSRLSLPSTSSHLVEHTLSLSAADCGTWLHVCVFCFTYGMIWIALPSYEVIWLRPFFQPPTAEFSFYRFSPHATEK